MELKGARNITYLGEVGRTLPLKRTIHWVEREDNIEKVSAGKLSRAWWNTGEGNFVATVAAHEY